MKELRLGKRQGVVTHAIRESRKAREKDGAILCSSEAIMIILPGSASALTVAPAA